MRIPRFALALALTVCAASAHAAVEAVDGGIQFSHTAPGASSVHLAGSFNDWNASALAMQQGANGVWTTTLALAAGTHEYKYVVDGGTWVADPDNARTGGDFGNSLVEIDADGQIVSGAVAPSGMPSGTPVISNNTLNSNVYVGGHFRMIMEGASDVEGDERLRLQRPHDEFNLDVTANLSAKLWGSLRLQLSTGEGGPNELETTLYKAQSNFVDDEFSVQAYYNEEVYDSHDPFLLLGAGDLRGTIAREARPFGQGTQGVLLRMQPYGSELSVIVADTHDEDIFNPSLPTVQDGDFRKEGLNQSTGTDILGLRLQRRLGRTRVGTTYRGDLSDWWVNFTKDENVYSQALLDHRDAQIAARGDADDASDNFELSNENHVLAFDASAPLGRGFSGQAAVGWTWYEARWAVGNRDELQGQGFDDGAVDIPIGNEWGNRGRTALIFERDDLSILFAHEIEYGEGMDAGENYVAYRSTPGSVIADRDVFVDSALASTYQDVNGADAVDVVLFGPRPERVNHLSELRFGYSALRDLSLQFSWDRTRENLSYVDFAGSGARGADRWRNRYSPTIVWAPFAGIDHHVRLETEFLRHEDPRFLEDAGVAGNVSPTPGQGAGHLFRLDSSEFVLAGLLPTGPLSEKNLSFQFDARWVSYDARADDFVDADDNVLDLERDFFNLYAALVWQPADAVQVHFGYGVDPTYYGVISPEGWPNGRQQFRDAYLIEQRRDPYHAINVLDAEAALEERRQFVINTFVRF